MSNQVFEVAHELGVKLEAAKFPFLVEYAPERIDRSDTANPVILVARDRMNGENILPPAQFQVNGRKMLGRACGVEIKVYARSSLPAPMIAEHEELADYIVDAVLCALYEIEKEGKFSPFEFTEARFMFPEEVVTAAGEPELWPGVVYVLRFKIARAVVKRDYLKQVRPQSSADQTGNVVEVRQKDSDSPVNVPIGTQPT